MDFITDLPLCEDNGATTLLVITDRLGKGTILLPVLLEQLDAESIALLLIKRYISLY
jgi:hypothetical protein